jgi:hypothetical protein
MVTLEELEERVKKIENILTLISREVMDQFDTKIKSAEVNLTREINTKIKLAESYLTREINNKIEIEEKNIIEKSQIKSLIMEAEEIKQMFKEIKENFDPYDLTKEIKEIRSVLKVIDFRVSHIEKQFKKIP